MRTFRVKNLEKYQHYKDRRPPWIKLHAELLEDYDFACLQDASKLLLILIWLLASRHENVLPWDSQWLSRRMNLTEPVDLDALSDAGFIIEIQEDTKPEQSASAALASRKQSATPEKETEEEKKESPLVPPKGAQRTFKQALDERDDLKEVCISESQRMFAEKGWPELDWPVLWDEFKSYWGEEAPRKKKANWPRTFYNRAVERRTWSAYQIEGTPRNGKADQAQSNGSAERVARVVARVERERAESLAGSGGNVDPVLPAVQGGRR